MRNFENYCAAEDSFIFSFKNNNNIENYVLSRVVDENEAVYNSYNYGPSFGRNDLYIWGCGDECSCIKGSYEKPIREAVRGFYVEECEVFQIVKN